MPNEKEYLAKKSLLDTKQDVLTPGDNITITNNRISAQVPVVDVLVNNQSVIGQDNIARVVVDTVDANPAQTPTDTLTSIDINGTVYELQGGGGGSDVIPNPVGTPTDTLSTIEIDGTIFDIAGSGGGSGGILDEVIFTDTAGTTGSRNITLTKSLNNFDAIYFEWFGTTEEQYAASHVSPVYPIEVNDNGNVSVVCYPTYGNRYIVLTGDPTSTSVSLQSGTWETVPLSVYKVHGLKFGGGSGGGKTSITTLYDTFINSVGEITLTNKIEDYDFIMVDFGFNGTDKAHDYMYIPADDFPNKYPYVSSPNNTNPHILLNPYDDQYARMIMGSADNKLFIFQIGQTVGIYGVYGIKCGSGGTNVEANPQDSPTDTLTTIKIGDTVFDIAGSGGGSSTIDVLYQADDSSGAPLNTLIAYSDNKHLSDYDLCYVYVTVTASGDAQLFESRSFCPKNQPKPVFRITGYGQRYTNIEMTDTDFTVTAETGESSIYTYKVYTIFGVKYGAGGGGGTSVEANPQEEPTDTLTKIKIEDTVYEIQGGGSSEGSGLQRTVLWDYIDDNAGTIPYDIYSVTLRDDINNYDAITLELVSWSDDLNGAWRGTNISNTFFVDVLNNQLEPGNVVVCTFAQRSVKFYIHDNIVSTTVRNESSTNGLVRVYGLTFGGGKAASEMIPITAGDGTTSRTFTFDKIPKKVSMQYIAGGWGFYRDIIWGADRSYYQASQATVSDSQTYVGVSGIVCDETAKSITITGLNALQASNTADIVGYMFVDYGGGGSGGSSEPDISDMTWTAITSTSYGQSTAVAIPQGTKRLVLTAEYDGIVTKVAEEKIENIQKLLDTSLKSTWNMGAEYADTAGNHTFVAMSVNNNLATAYSGYSGVVVKIYALS